MWGICRAEANYLLRQQSSQSQFWCLSLNFRQKSLHNIDKLRTFSQYKVDLSYYYTSLEVDFFLSYVLAPRIVMLYAYFYNAHSTCHYLHHVPTRRVHLPILDNAYSMASICTEGVTPTMLNRLIIRNNVVTKVDLLIEIKMCPTYLKQSFGVNILMVNIMS